MRAHNPGMSNCLTQNASQLAEHESKIAGEAFDKVARLLGLDLRPNGGAALEKFAREGNPNRFKFTVPLRQRADCNFSFAGLKTAISLAIQKEGLQVHANPLSQCIFGSCMSHYDCFCVCSATWLESRSALAVSWDR